MTDPTASLRSLLDQLLQIHRSAREMGSHEVSFHVLSAAAHAAQDLGDQEELTHVAELSRDELAWLRRNNPHHRLAAGVATQHHDSVFEQLAVTATAMRQRIHSDRVIEEARARAGLAEPPG
ncbi:MAG TPA: hypothetical protein VFS20_34000 [Longimicrobium sp.]|nr:hypothetical protein [Longimicrobium sp.]